MKEDLETRAQELAVYIIEHRTTIRDAAKHFGVSKSTVHVEVTVQNVSGGLSHKPEINKGGKQIASRPFFALCCLFDDYIIHLHIQIPAERV